MQDYEESEVVDCHIPCDSCGSSDGASRFSDGHTFCFVCDKYTPSSTGGVKYERKGHMAKDKEPMIPKENLECLDLRSRGILKATCQKYGYYCSKYRGKGVQIAEYTDPDTMEVIGQKMRGANKAFRTLGDIPDIFFGQHLFKGGGKKLIIGEGCIDTLTLSQISGNKYPVVGLPKGSKSAKRCFLKNLKWLESFDEVVVCFDADEAGLEAVKDIQGILSHGKLKIAHLPMKDPNEMLVAGKTEELNRCLWNAETYKPEGIVDGRDLRDKIKGLKEKQMGYALPWDIELQQMIKGLRQAEVTLFTAGSGIGKSTIVKAVGHHLGVHQDVKMGCLFLEESPEVCAQGIMSIESGKPLHLEGKDDDPMLSEEMWEEVFQRSVGNGNFIFYDHFGSLEGSTLITQMRHMAVAEGCKFLILDHISIAVSGLEGDNERRIIDKLMTDITVLTQETGVGVLIISHLRKTDGKGKSHEEGGKISLDDLRGSGSLKQLSFTVIALERNQQTDDPRERDLLLVRVLKCRFTGNTGVGGYLWFNKETNSLEAIKDVDEFLGREAESSGFVDETEI